MTAIFVMGSHSVGIFLFVTCGVYYTKSRNLLLAYLLSLYMNYHCFMTIQLYTVKLSPWNSGNMPTSLLALHSKQANFHTQIFRVCKCAIPCINKQCSTSQVWLLYPLPHSFAITGMWLVTACAYKNQATSHLYCVLVWDFQNWFWQDKTEPLNWHCNASTVKLS